MKAAMHPNGNESGRTELAEASIRVCYPFAIDLNAGVAEWRARLVNGVTLGALAEHWPIPDALRARLSGKSEQPVWEVYERSISKDLYPHVRRLLGAEASASNTCLQLTVTAWQLLDGEFGDYGEGLELQLTNVAAKRLGLESPDENGKYWLPFSCCRGLGGSKLSPPMLHLSGSGIGVLELEFSPEDAFIQRLGVEGAVELTHAISHAGGNLPELRWRKSATNGQALTTTLMAILEHLLPVGDEAIEPLVSSRLFTYTCLRLDGPCEAESARNLAFRSSRRQTTHYLPSARAHADGLYEPFENITHAMCTEGGSAIIADVPVAGQPVLFFRQYIRSVIKDAYWPMVLLAYAEFLKLVRTTGDVCREIDFNSPDESDQQFLERFRQDILNFRLNYRFSQASQITHHNEYFSRWRAALGCDRLLAELAEDVSEVDGHLEHILEKKRLGLEKEIAEASRQHEEARQRLAALNSRRYGYFGILISAIVLVTGLLGSNLVEFTNTSITHPIVWWTTGIIIGLTLLVILVRWWMDRRADK